jgi:hypothetical protein
MRGPLINPGGTAPHPIQLCGGPIVQDTLAEIFVGSDHKTISPHSSK